MSSKKRKAGGTSPLPPRRDIESDIETASVASAAVSHPSRPFKNPSYHHKRDKTLKQILTAEKNINWGPDISTFGTIDAPPSLLPGPKYCDITGLPARYTDPKTKLRYYSVAEFNRIQELTEDVVKYLLALRKERYGLFLD